MACSPDLSHLTRYDSLHRRILARGASVSEFPPGFFEGPALVLHCLPADPRRACRHPRRRRRGRLLARGASPPSSPPTSAGISPSCPAASPTRRAAHVAAVARRRAPRRERGDVLELIHGAGARRPAISGPEPARGGGMTQFPRFWSAMVCSPCLRRSAVLAAAAPALARMPLRQRSLLSLLALPAEPLLRAAKVEDPPGFLRGLRMPAS